MKKKGNFDYHFKLRNPADYDLLISFRVENRVLKHLFSMSKKKLSKGKNIKVEGDTDAIKRFDILPEYLNLVKTTMKSMLKMVKEEVGRDGIKVLNTEILSGEFIRTDDLWTVEIKLEGTYTDER